MSSRMASCIFCKIIKGMPPNPEAMRPCFAFCERARAEIFFLGDIPCFKLFESDKTLAFIDINPLSRGHAVRRLLGPGPPANSFR